MKLVGTLTGRKTLVGNLSRGGTIEGDKFFSFLQMSPAEVWHIEHNLHKFPAVTVVDSGGTCVVGDTEYIDEDNVKITFQSAFAGKAYLN